MRINGERREKRLDKFTYDTTLYPFKDVVEYWFHSDGILSYGSLDKLHSHKDYSLFTREKIYIIIRQMSLGSTSRMETF